MQKGVSLEPQTKKILPSALFGKLNGFFRSIGWKVPDYVYLDYSLVVAIVMGLLIWFLLFRTRQGFEIRAVGTSIDVSRYAGIRVKRVQMGAFLLSGAIAGLIGLQEIFAIRGFYTYNIASGARLRRHRDLADRQELARRRGVLRRSCSPSSSRPATACSCPPRCPTPSPTPSRA